MSRIVCEKCEGAQGHCRKCQKPWATNYKGQHRCHFEQLRATEKRNRVPCDGKHDEFKCDRCGVVAVGKWDRHYSHAIRRRRHAEARTNRRDPVRSALCRAPPPKSSRRVDAAMGNEDASKLDEAINRVESIACAWAFDLGRVWSRTAVTDFAGGFAVPTHLRQAVIDLIRSDGAAQLRVPPHGFHPITPSQQIEQEDGEYSREEYR